MTPGLLIVGGGLAAQRCCETLRALGHTGPITIVGGERCAPYDRPPLSKDLLAGEPVDAAFRPAGWYAEHDVELRLGVRAARLRADRRVVELADGERLRYDDLLIATGSEPVALPILAEREGVQALRTLDDAARLRGALQAGTAVAVVGGGLIGLEVASTARRLGARVTVIEAGPLPLRGLLGAPVAARLVLMHREEGTDLRLGAPVAEAREGELLLADGSSVAADHVVAAVGVRPATGWLVGSALAPRSPSAIAVDEGGRTALPRVYAAGDVTGGGHWSAAARQGAAVARTLLGLAPAPHSPPSFWSDQLGMRLSCVGSPRGADRVHVEADTDGRGFEATYEAADSVVAVLLADRPASALRAARRRLTDPIELERSAA